jgi:hypothetical protein
MTKAIDAHDILTALPPEARQEFKDRLRSEAGVTITLTTATPSRKRKKKHNFASAKGHVVGIRFTDEQYAVVFRRAADNGRSPGDYLKWLGTRSHLKPKRISGGS